MLFATQFWIDFRASVGRVSGKEVGSWNLFYNSFLFENSGNNEFSVFNNEFKKLVLVLVIRLLYTPEAWAGIETMIYLYTSGDQLVVLEKRKPWMLLVVALSHLYPLLVI